MDKKRTRFAARAVEPMAGNSPFGLLAVNLFLRIFHGADDGCLSRV